MNDTGLHHLNMHFVLRKILICSKNVLVKVFYSFIVSKFYCINDPIFSQSMDFSKKSFRKNMVW